MVYPSIVALNGSEDPITFSEGALGAGCGIDPLEEIVYAPFDGVVSQVTDTKHAVGMTSTDGMELLIHVGMDTVDINGRGFACFVQKGQAIQAGQPLMRFIMVDIKAANHPAVTAVVLTNSDEFATVELLAEGTVQHGAPLLKIKK